MLQLKGDLLKQIETTGKIILPALFKRRLKTKILPSPYINPLK